MRGSYGTTRLGLSWFWRGFLLRLDKYFSDVDEDIGVLTVNEWVGVKLWGWEGKGGEVVFGELELILRAAAADMYNNSLYITVSSAAVAVFYLQA